ncbi:MAG: cysteine synthase family protein [Pelagibacterales bacterium]|nr:cysteine synthase family protein [Pelagibacterales bacterium]
MQRLSSSVGNTPLVPIRSKDSTVWAKAELMNPGGSVKDRMATYILDGAEKRGLIKKGDTLIEATSGNTGISFAMLAAERGYNMKIVMPSNMSEERKKIFNFYGAELIEVEAGDFDGAIALRDDLAGSNGFFNCNQFHNKLNIEAHYKITGPEILKNFRKEAGADKFPDVIIMGTGTGGTIMGTGKFLREIWPIVKIVAVEPAESPVMSGGESGLHGIQGIGDGSKFLVDLDFIDEVVTVSTEDAKERARELSKNGLFVGISSGANVLAAERWLKDNNKQNAITILCDRGERYFSCL